MKPRTHFPRGQKPYRAIPPRNRVDAWTIETRQRYVKGAEVWITWPTRLAQRAKLIKVIGQSRDKDGRNIYHWTFQTGTKAYIPRS